MEKDNLNEIFVKKHHKEVYDKIEKMREESILDDEKMKITVGEYRKLKNALRENNDLRNLKESYEILVYKAIEITKQEYNLFDKEFCKMSDKDKIKALHKILDESERLIRKFYGSA